MENQNRGPAKLVLRDGATRASHPLPRFSSKCWVCPRTGKHGKWKKSLLRTSKTSLGILVLRWVLLLAFLTIVFSFPISAREMLPKIKGWCELTGWGSGSLFQSLNHRQDGQCSLGPRWEPIHNKRHVRDRILSCHEEAPLRNRKGVSCPIPRFVPRSMLFISVNTQLIL